MAGCGLFLHLGSAESLKTQEQKIYLSNRHSQSPRYQRALFIQPSYSCFLNNNPKIPPIALSKGQRSKRQFFNSLRWPVYVINLVTNTKLPRYTRR